MLDFRSFALNKLSRLSTRYLPFADVASDDVPMTRLLRLSLFQVTVGMALVLLVGTLNRVMIVELGVSAALVSVMIALPILFAPLRALIGFKSDTHSSALGLRRFPYIYRGTLLQFGGFAIMPFALLVLSGYGEAIDAPRWIGLSSAALSFLLVGAGVHMVQTVGLALATDLVPQEDQPKVVGLMYVMLLIGMIGSAFIFGALLENYSPGRLIQVIQGAAVITVLLNGFSVWKQEPRGRHVKAVPAPPFSVAWERFANRAGAKRLLTVIALGTFAFGIADVIIEPYGGQVLRMSVAATTKLTATLALGTLFGLAVASRILGRGGSPTRMCLMGALVGIPGYIAIILASPLDWLSLFVAGTFATGVGAGLFGHGTLTATMRSAPKTQTGLALGAWGAVQATAAGAGVALGGVIRDLMLQLQGDHQFAPEVAYLPVFSMQILFLAFALVAVLPLLRLHPTRPDHSAYLN
ncbi:MFS transporter [Ruegeria sp. HKCCD4884]|uniref:PucC family protein n=1 Tax=Ruegeria sp. HKCCD4884 TaxID=2683022 RepID=UPI0014931C25|nr:MFS transporter [Ruegeria sp. HKCCD4884]